MFNIGSLNGLHGLDFESIEETILEKENTCSDLLDEVESTVENRVADEEIGLSDSKEETSDYSEDSDNKYEDSDDNYKELDDVYEDSDDVYEDSDDVYEDSDDSYEDIEVDTDEDEYDLDEIMDDDEDYENESDSLEASDEDEYDLDELMDDEGDYEEEDLSDEDAYEEEEDLSDEGEDLSDEDEDLSDEDIENLLDDDEADNTSDTIGEDNTIRARQDESLSGSQEEIDNSKELTNLYSGGNLDDTDDVDIDSILDESSDYEETASEVYAESNNQIVRQEDKSIINIENKKETVDSVKQQNIIKTDSVSKVSSEKIYSDLDELKLRLERLELEKRIRDLEEDLGKKKESNNEKGLENDNRLDVSIATNSIGTNNNSSTTVPHDEEIKNIEPIKLIDNKVNVSEINSEAIVKPKEVRRKKVVKPKPKEIDYSTLDISALFNIVQSYMLSRNIGKQLISRKEIEEKFGRDNVKKLIKKGYIIAIGEKVTIS